MNTQEMKIIAENNGYESTDEMIKEKCPSEMGYIDYGTLDKYCIGEYNKKICTKCWREATCPEDIEANIMAEENNNAAEKQQEQVRHPAYYQQPNRRECIEEMRLMFGDEKVYWWCVMTAYKYRYRMGNKDGNPAEQDEAKSEWYLDYAEGMKK